MITYNFTTTSKTILADLYTPVGVYMRLRDLYPQSALMESSDYHEKDNSRSFIGIGPMASVAIGHGVATITYPDGSTLQHEVTKDYRSDKAIHELIDRINVTIPALMPYAILRISTSRTRHKPRTMPPTCSIYYIRW